jgi:hypothetical protein
MGSAIQTTSTSKVRRVDFGDCGPPANNRYRLPSPLKDVRPRAQAARRVRATLELRLLLGRARRLEDPFQAAYLPRALRAPSATFGGYDRDLARARASCCSSLRRGPVSPASSLLLDFYLYPFKMGVALNARKFE